MHKRQVNSETLIARKDMTFGNLLLPCSPAANKGPPATLREVLLRG